MTDHNALIAEARDWAEWNRKISLSHNQNQRRLLNALADALEAATVERAVVEAQALEQAAEKVRYECGREASGHTSTYSVRNWLFARAVEIREGRQ